MKLIVNYSSNITSVPIKYYDTLNSYIHKVLGENNEYHDKFSEYSISSLQGGTLENGYLEFQQGAKLIISSNSIEFLTKMTEGVTRHTHFGYGMTFKNVVFDEYNVGEYFDKIQTICPLVLKDKKTNKYVWFEHENFIKILTEQSKVKLRRLDSSLKLNDLEFKIFKPENAKYRKTYVNDISYTRGSQLRLIVTGNKKTRKAIYNMGLGVLTGSGFGAIKICDSNE